MLSHDPLLHDLQLSSLPLKASTPYLNCSLMSSEYRRRALYLFKELTYMVHDLPTGQDVFMNRIKSGFRARGNLTSDKDVEASFQLGEHIKGELEALHKLRVYRAVKRNYY